MTLETLKEAIAELLPEEKTALVNWLNEQEMDEWDRQMQSDFSRGGRGESVVEDVKAGIRSGRFRPLDSKRS